MGAGPPAASNRGCSSTSPSMRQGRSGSAVPTILGAGRGHGRAVRRSSFTRTRRMRPIPWRAVATIEACRSAAGCAGWRVFRAWVLWFSAPAWVSGCVSCVMTLIAGERATSGPSRHNLPIDGLESNDVTLLHGELLFRGEFPAALTFINGTALAVGGGLARLARPDGRVGSFAWRETSTAQAPSGASRHNLRTRTWVTARNRRRITAPHTRTFSHGEALAEQADDSGDECPGPEHGADHPADEPGLEVRDLGG